MTSFNNNSNHNSRNERYAHVVPNNYLSIQCAKDRDRESSHCLLFWNFTMIKQVIDVQHIFFFFFRFRINLYNCKANKYDSIIIILLKNVASKYFALCFSITSSYSYNFKPSRKKEMKKKTWRQTEVKRKENKITCKRPKTHIHTHTHTTARCVLKTNFANHLEINRNFKLKSINKNHRP